MWKHIKTIFLNGYRLKEIGSGDFLISDGELISYSGNDKEVTVPEGVTGIGGNAFLNTKVEKVTLTSQVTEIGAYAFEKCKSLKAVDVEASKQSCNSRKLCIQ